MGTYSTHRQVRFQYRRAMGPTLGPLFHKLVDECSWLHIRWAQYEALFGVSPERLEILNSSAGLFFRIVQDALWADVLLALCRLTDAPEMRGRKNLTLKGLPSLLTGKRLQQATSARVKKLVTATKFARDWRNRHLAHNDLVHSMTPHKRPLAKATRLKVRGALRALTQCLNHVQSHYCKSTTYYDLKGDPGDAVALLYVLRDGIAVNEKRLERLRSGNVLPEDLEPPRAV